MKMEERKGMGYYVALLMKNQESLKRAFRKLAIARWMNGAQVLLTQINRSKEQSAIRSVSFALKVAANSLSCPSSRQLLYLIIKRQLGRPSQTLLCIIAADVPCGSGVETMAPSCSMCERNNDSKSNSWCSGFCLFDAVDRVCKERCKFLSYNPPLPIKSIIVQF